MQELMASTQGIADKIASVSKGIEEAALTQPHHVTLLRLTLTTLMSTLTRTLTRT